MKDEEFELVEQIVTAHMEAAQTLILNAIAAISEAGRRDE